MDYGMAGSARDPLPGPGTLNGAAPARVKVSGDGQVTIPAAVRRRWGSKEVIILDRGDRLIVRPVLSLDELAGRYKHIPGPTTDELRTMEREEEARREGLIP